jgi:hypothetical protein
MWSGKNFKVMLLFAALADSVSTAPRAEVVLEWNEIMVEALTGQNPAEETRLAAITQLAVFEAVNSITRDHQPYLGTIRAPHGASADASAVTAAHGVLRNYVPARAAELDAARVRSLSSIQDGPAKDDGIAVGEAAAAAMIAFRTDDGSAAPLFYLPESSAAGAWQLTPACTPRGGVFLHLPDMRPFGIRNGSQFRAAPPPSLTSPKYTAAYKEVKRVGGEHSTARPQDRADVARFYAAVLAVRTWNPVARQIAIAHGTSLSENARAFALLNMALIDAMIAVFDTKYDSPFWRPETAIRAGDDDGNRDTRGDPDFKPFVTTPCHPSYASTHASQANAARAVLERIYGSGGHAIALSDPLVPGIVLEYRRLREITADIDDARVFGGTHFRFDQEAGARLGRGVGRFVHRHNLRPMHGRDCEP